MSKAATLVELQDLEIPVTDIYFPRFLVNALLFIKIASPNCPDFDGVKPVFHTGICT